MPEHRDPVWQCEADASIADAVRAYCEDPLNRLAGTWPGDETDAELESALAKFDMRNDKERESGCECPGWRAAKERCER